MTTNSVAPIIGTGNHPHRLLPRFSLRRPLRPHFSEPRERQRKRDDYQKCFDKWFRLDSLGNPRSHEEPEEHRKQQELNEHQGWRRRGNLFGVAACEFGEGDDVVDARR